MTEPAVRPATQPRHPPVARFAAAISVFSVKLHHYCDVVPWRAAG
jgi:hypothetical protein